MADAKLAGRYRPLGADVWLDTIGDGPPAAIVNGTPHHRFMDVLYLPATTVELGVEAIKTINRWREDLIAASFLPHRDRVRRVASAMVSALGAESMLEIGCGKFPLGPELGIQRYAGLEIDDEAIRDGTARGIRVTADLAELRRDPPFETVVSLFTMQFAMPDATIDLVRAAGRQAVLFFNMCTHDETLAATRLEQVGSSGLSIAVLDLSTAGVHDRLVVGWGPAARSERDTAMIQKRPSFTGVNLTVATGLVAALGDIRRF